MPFNQTAGAQEKLWPGKALDALGKPLALPGMTESDWVRISTVYTDDMRIRARAEALNPDGSIDSVIYQRAILGMIVLATSDGAPPDIASWHPLVCNWVEGEFQRLSAGRTPEEKKESRTNSADGLVLEPEPSPVNSLT